MNPATIALAEELVQIAIRATAAIKQLKTDSPEVYAAIGQHHHDALANAQAELAKP
jgi:hypothetical protein